LEGGVGRRRHGTLLDVCCRPCSRQPGGGPGQCVTLADGSGSHGKAEHQRLSTAGWWRTQAAVRRRGTLHGDAVSRVSLASVACARTPRLWTASAGYRFGQVARASRGLRLAKSWMELWMGHRPLIDDDAREHPDQHDLLQKRSGSQKLGTSRVVIMSARLDTISGWVVGV